MSDSFINHLPVHERNKWIEMKERSPAEYLRERKKYQEGLRERQRLSEKGSEFADFNFAFESEPKFRESVKEKIKEGLKRGAEGVIDGKIDAATKHALESGYFDVSVDHSQSVPKLKVKPQSKNEKQSAAEGNIAEALPLKPVFQDKLILLMKIQKNY